MGTLADQPLTSACGVAAATPRLDVARVTGAVARGDHTALEEFYRAWFDGCLAMARGLTRRDESFCLDVVQDAMLRVVKSMRAMAGQDDLERWMKRVVHTAALDRLREERRRAVRENRKARLGSAGGTPSEEPDVGERIDWLREQLRVMEAHDRMILVARIGDGSTLERTGAGVGISGDAARGRVRRALKRLRAAAKEVFGD